MSLLFLPVAFAKASSPAAIDQASSRTRHFSCSSPPVLQYTTEKALSRRALPYLYPSALSFLPALLDRKSSTQAYSEVRRGKRRRHPLAWVLGRYTLEGKLVLFLQPLQSHPDAVQGFGQDFAGAGKIEAHEPLSFLAEFSPVIEGHFCFREKKLEGVSRNPCRQSSQARYVASIWVIRTPGSFSERSGRENLYSPSDSSGPDPAIPARLYRPPRQPTMPMIFTGGMTPRQPFFHICGVRDL